MREAPLGSSNYSKYDKGSLLVYDGDHTIYCHKARRNELFAYDVSGDTWRTQQLTGMPFYDHTGRSKKAGPGSCGAWLNGSIYALKGGGTAQFWRYAAAHDSWYELDPMPCAGTTKRVKHGGDIAAQKDGMLYAFRGGKSREFWCYVPGAPGMPSGGGQPGGGGGGEDSIILGLGCSEPRWNRDGTLVTYCRTGENGLDAVFVCDGETETPVDTLAMNCTSPVFSPDGERIAFVADDPATGYQQLAVAVKAESAGYTACLITGSSREHDHCEWSPAGSSLICEADGDYDRTQLWVVDPDSGSEKEMTHDDAEHLWPVYIDKTRVAYISSPDDNWDQVFMLDLETGQTKQLTFEETDHDRPKVSDDGTVVWEGLDPEGVTAIGVATTGGDGSRFLTTGDCDMESPTWSADGSIYCTQWLGLTSAICWVDAGTGQYQPVTDSASIRDNPNVFYDSAQATNEVVYEREATGGLLFGGRFGSGIFRVRHKPAPAGLTDAALYPVRLERLAPNPARGNLRISWQVSRTTHASLKVYTIAGQLVNTLVNAETKPGRYVTAWDGTDNRGRRLATGVYFVALEADKQRINRKVVLTGNR